MRRTHWNDYADLEPLSQRDDSARLGSTRSLLPGRLIRSSPIDHLLVAAHQSPPSLSSIRRTCGACDRDCTHPHRRRPALSLRTAGKLTRPLRQCSHCGHARRCRRLSVAAHVHGLLDLAPPLVTRRAQRAARVHPSVGCRPPCLRASPRRRCARECSPLWTAWLHCTNGDISKPSFEGEHKRQPRGQVECDRDAHRTCSLTPTRSSGALPAALARGSGTSGTKRRSALCTAARRLCHSFSIWTSSA